MEQYIPKSALVAEIESKKKYAQTLGNNAINSSMQQFYDGMKQGCVDILSFLDTLEVKGVDLDEEVRKWQQKHFEGIGYVLDGSGGWIGKESLLDVAKHFFELGLKAKKKLEA